MNHILTLKSFLENFGAPLVLLAARLKVAFAFFKSGWLKFGYILNDQADTLYFLFEDYNVPFLPVKLAAWMGMIGEVVLSALLAVGLLSRFAAAGLIVMAGVIYAVDQNPQAVYWALICAIIVTMGAGKISTDHYLWKWVSRRFGV